MITPDQFLVNKCCIVIVNCPISRFPETSCWPLCPISTLIALEWNGKCMLYAPFSVLWTELKCQSASLHDGSTHKYSINYCA